MLVAPELLTVAEQLRLLQLRCYVQLQRDCQLPAFKGSLLHGWFGHALMAVDSRVYDLCYGQHDSQQPKPYQITPLSQQTEWRAGEVLGFDLSLFGAACELAPVMLKALTAGETLGLGSARTPFKVLSLVSRLPGHERLGLHACPLLDWLPAISLDAHLELALQLQTPLRLKNQQGHLLKRAPMLDDLLRAARQRLFLLARHWGEMAPTDISAFGALRFSLGDYSAQPTCYLEDWQRYSFRQREQLPFGGLKGQLAFFGDIAPALPLLLLGEQLHLGGKTTFGLGRYRLLY